MKRILFVLAIIHFCFFIETIFCHEKVVVIPLITKSNVSIIIDGSTYYVDATNGNDSNDGLTSAEPWQTIDPKVNEFLFKPGDKVLFKRGEVWNNTLIVPSSGEKDNPIIFGAYGNGNRPLINVNSSKDYSVHITKAHIIIEDLELSNSQHHGVFIQGDHYSQSMNVVLNNLYIHDEGTHGIKIIASDIIINNSEIGFIQDDGIYATGFNIEIANSKIHDVDLSEYPGDCIHLNLEADNYYVHHNILDHSNTTNKGAFMSSDANDSNGIFEFNTVYESGGYGFSDIGRNVTCRYNQFFSMNSVGNNIGIKASSENGRYYNNIVKDFHTGIYLRSNSKNITINNNDFYNVQRGVDANIADNNTTSFEFKNNIVYLEENGDAYVISIQSSMDSNNNILFPQTNGFIQYHGQTYNDLTTFSDDTGNDIDSLSIDPFDVDEVSQRNVRSFIYPPQM